MSKYNLPLFCCSCTLFVEVDAAVVFSDLGSRLAYHSDTSPLSRKSQSHLLRSESIHPHIRKHVKNVNSSALALDAGQLVQPSISSSGLLDVQEVGTLRTGKMIGRGRATHIAPKSAPKVHTGHVGVTAKGQVTHIPAKTGAVSDTPSFGKSLHTGQAPQYQLFNRGACHAQESASHMGSWVAGRDKAHAEKICNAEPDCEGYHWIISGRSYILVNRVGPLHEEHRDGEECYKKPYSCNDPGYPYPDLEGFCYTHQTFAELKSGPCSAWCVHDSSGQIQGKFDEKSQGDCGSLTEKLCKASECKGAYPHQSRSEGSMCFKLSSDAFDGSPGGDGKCDQWCETEKGRGQAAGFTCPNPTLCPWKEAYTYTVQPGYCQPETNLCKTAEFLPHTQNPSTCNGFDTLGLKFLSDSAAQSLCDGEPNCMGFASFHGDHTFKGMVQLFGRIDGVVHSTQVSCHVKHVEGTDAANPTEPDGSMEVAVPLEGAWVQSGDSVFIENEGNSRVTYLDVRGKDCQKNVRCVSAASSTAREGLSATWQIWRRNGKGGIKDGDTVFILNMLANPTTFLDVRGNKIENGVRHNYVSTSTSPERSGLSGSWIIERELGGGTVRDGDVVFLRSMAGEAGYLGTHGAGCQMNTFCVTTAAASRSNSMWRLQLARGVFNHGFHWRAGESPPPGAVKASPHQYVIRAHGLVGNLNQNSNLADIPIDGVATRVSSYEYLVAEHAGYQWISSRLPPLGAVRLSTSSYVIEAQGIPGLARVVQHAGSEAGLANGVTSTAFVLVHNLEHQVDSYKFLVPNPTHEATQLQFKGEGCCTYSGMQARDSQFIGILDLQSCLESCEQSEFCVAATLVRGQESDGEQKYTCSVVEARAPVFDVQTGCPSVAHALCYARQMDSSAVAFDLMSNDWCMQARARYRGLAWIDAAIGTGGKAIDCEQKCSTQNTCTGYMTKMSSCATIDESQETNADVSGPIDMDEIDYRGLCWMKSFEHRRRRSAPTPETYSGVSSDHMLPSSHEPASCTDKYDLGALAEPWRNFQGCAKEKHLCWERPYTLQVGCCASCKALLISGGQAPTSTPTLDPTPTPTTHAPTPVPTHHPTPSPTQYPTPSPTPLPTRSPTPSPPTPPPVTPGPTPVPTSSPPGTPPTLAPSQFVLNASAGTGTGADQPVQSISQPPSPQPVVTQIVVGQGPPDGNTQTFHGKSQEWVTANGWVDDESVDVRIAKETERFNGVFQSEILMGMFAIFLGVLSLAMADHFLGSFQKPKGQAIGKGEEAKEPGGQAPKGEGEREGQGEDKGERGEEKGEESNLAPDAERDDSVMISAAATDANQRKSLESSEWTSEQLPTLWRSDYSG